MPSQSPHRVMLTLTPQLHQTLKEASTALDRPMATILLEMLQAAEPELVALTGVARQLREAKAITGAFLGVVLNRGLQGQAQGLKVPLRALSAAGER